ncbi:MAG: glycosyl hydrolase family 28-related protein [Bryobacteraceae bacterium]
MPLLFLMLLVATVQASPLNVRLLGAAGDGIADDSGSIQSAIDRVNAEGGCVYIPAGTYRLGRTLTVKVAALRGLCIAGDGPTSVLLAAGDGAGLEITGTAGLSYELVYLSGFKIKSAPGSGMSAGLHMAGVAGFGIANLQIDGSEGSMQYGLLLSGAQQGYIKGGLNYRAAVGVGLEDSSNGVEISGVSFNDLDAAVQVTGVDDGFFHANHATSSRYGVHIISTGSGAYIIESNHFELHASGSIYQEAGLTFVRNNVFYNKETELDIAAGTSLISENLINGTVSFGAGITRSVFRDNICFGHLLDHSRGGVAFSGERGN